MQCSPRDGAAGGPRRESGRPSLSSSYSTLRSQIKRENQPQYFMLEAPQCKVGVHLTGLVALASEKYFRGLLEYFPLHTDSYQLNLKLAFSVLSFSSERNPTGPCLPTIKPDPVLTQDLRLPVRGRGLVQDDSGVHGPPRILPDDDQTAALDLLVFLKVCNFSDTER